MERKNTVVICRGWSGGGKTYETNKIIENFKDRHVICSADHFFTNSSGVYNFDRNLLGKAHAACRDKFVKALEAGIPLVIVDNTNVVFSDLKDYVSFAAMADYNVKLVESKAPWRNNIKECFKRNQHGVPLETIQRMYDRYQSNEEVARFCLENLGVEVEYV